MFRPTNAYFAEHRTQIRGGMRILLINLGNAPVMIGSLCCEIQSKEIIVERAYWQLIVEVCSEALRFS